MASFSIIDEIIKAGKLTNKVSNDVAGTINDIDSLRHKSFARGAMDSVLQFPCLVSSAIPIDMASTIARTLERVYASFVQTYLSANSTIDISVDKNPQMFLQKFHRNLKLESTQEDLYKENFTEEDSYYDELMKRIYDGTTKAFINENENSLIVFNFSDKFDRHVYEQNKELLEDTLACIDYLPFPNVGNSPYYKEAPLSPDELHELQIKNLEQSMMSQNRRNEELLKNKLSVNRDAMLGDKLRVPVMTDNDTKKSNDMQPYQLQVRLMAINNNNEFVQFMDFIVGIKVVLHNVKSEDMIINIQNTLQNNGKLFNFIRWTTGEKSLFKDLILHLDDTKLDIANRSQGGSPYFVTLKRLKEKSRILTSFFARTQIVPNSTIVISSYDVDAIQKNFGFSIKDPRFAKQVMNNLFLMNFVIIDEGTRTVDILYDGESSFQTYALETLEREVTNNSNKIGRELTRMISR